MPTKTILLELDAYERLRAARMSPRESFSEVVRRLANSGQILTASQWLALRRAQGPILTESDIETIDDLNAADAPPDIP